MSINSSVRKFFPGLIAGLSMLAAAGAAVAHHGTGVSNDMQNPWYTDATLVSYTFANPHPRVVFDRVNEKGEVERWECEGGGNPSMILRWGWSRADLNKALQPGAKLKLGIRRSRANPTSGLVMEIWDQDGNTLFAPMPKEQGVNLKPGMASR